MYGIQDNPIGCKNGLLRHENRWFYLDESGACWEEESLIFD